MRFWLIWTGRYGAVKSTHSRDEHSRCSALRGEARSGCILARDLRFSSAMKRRHAVARDQGPKNPERLSLRYRDAVMIEHSMCAMCDDDRVSNGATDADTDGEGSKQLCLVWC